MQRYPRSILAMLLFVAFALSANAQTLGPQDDTWTTGNGTQVDFSNFGNLDLGKLLGSAPTSTVVTFNGVPLDSSIGQADTLVARGSVTVSDQFSTTLSLKALSLVSSPDLVLQDGRVYHVAVSLATQDGGGQMDFTLTSSEGGTYSSSFIVTPIFTLTNVNDPSESAHSINCLTDTQYSCSFPMHGGGNWLLTSSDGFDPQSQGIPSVPAGVKLGNYTTVGRTRLNSVQVGCGGTKAAGYHCGPQDNTAELHGFMGEASGHNVKPSNDCAQNPPPPSPSPSPSPRPAPVPVANMKSAPQRTAALDITQIDKQALNCATDTVK